MNVMVSHPSIESDASATLPAFCLLKPIPDDISKITFVVTVISCTASILASVAIFALYYKLPGIRTNSRKLLLFLTIADCLTASSNLFGMVRFKITESDAWKQWSDGWCIGQSFVTTYSNLCSFYWTAAISLFLLLPVARPRKMGKRFHIISHCICWLLPGIIVVLAVHNNALGEDRAHTSGGWCWIEGCNISANDRLKWMIVTGKGWEIAVYILTAVNYILLKYFLYKHRHRTAASSAIDVRYVLRSGDKNFLYVPMLLYLLRLWGTIRFVLAIPWSGDESYQKNANQVSMVLQPVQGFGDSGQAFWNFVVFFILDSTTRSEIYSWNCTAVNEVQRADGHLKENHENSDDGNCSENGYGPGERPTETSALLGRQLMNFDNQSLNYSTNSRGSLQGE